MQAKTTGKERSSQSLRLT